MPTKKSSVLNRVEQALEDIRPYLRTDGGDVELLEITKEGIVKLKLLGACETCSMSSMTMKSGIEKSILRSVPEVKAVEAVDL